MKKLWYLSLVVLLLGNAGDVLLTYFGLQGHSILAEADPLARQFILDRGLRAFLFAGIVVWGPIQLFIWILPIWLLVRVFCGHHHAKVAASLAALSLGMAHFFAGLEWLPSFRPDILPETSFLLVVLETSSSLMLRLYLFLPLFASLFLLASGRGKVGGLIGRSKKALEH